MSLKVYLVLHGVYVAKESSVMIRVDPSYHGNDSFQIVRPNTELKHTTAESKPNLISKPIFKVIDQSIAKRHNFYLRFRMADGPCPFTT